VVDGTVNKISAKIVQQPGGNKSRKSRRYKKRRSYKRRKQTRRR